MLAPRSKYPHVRHVPNALTLLRFLLIPLLLVLLTQQRYGAAFAVFVLSAVSDVADGLVARLANACSRFGAIADPVADKLTMLAVTVTLAAQGLFPIALLVAIVVRDAVIVAGALAYHTLFGRYDMEPTILSKLNTGVAFVTLATVLAHAAGLVDGNTAVRGLFALLAMTIVASGVQYVWTWGRRAIRRRAQSHVSTKR